MFNIERLVKVTSLEQAYELNQSRSNVVLGGFMWMKMANRSIVNAIDLSGLGLDGIEETAQEYRIGAMCSLRSLETHPGLHAEFNGAFFQALHHIVGVQFRNGATVGGSICGRFGFSDVLTCLLALDTRVELFKGGILPLAEYLALKPDTDILVAVRIGRDGRKVSYHSQRNTQSDFPVINVAGAWKEGTLYLAVGARPAKASLLVFKDPGIGPGSSPEALGEFAERTSEEFSYGKDMRAGAAYRKHLAAVYIRRALTEILGGEKA